MNKLRGCKKIILFWIKSVLIKSYGDEVKDFHDKEIPVVDSNYTCLAVLSLDSALKTDGNYYLQLFLKEFK